MARKRRKRKGGSKLKRQFRRAAKRATYGPSEKPGRVTVRSMETGEVVGVYRQAALTGHFKDADKQKDDWISERFAHLGFKSYGGYLRSKHWRSMRLRWVDAGRSQRCAVCGKAEYSLHHKTYDRLGCEELDDLAPVCKGHHKMAHDLIGKRRLGRKVTLANAVDILAEIAAEEDCAIEEAFEEAA